MASKRKCADGGMAGGKSPMKKGGKGDKKMPPWLMDKKGKKK